MMLLHNNDEIGSFDLLGRQDDFRARMQAGGIRFDVRPRRKYLFGSRAAHAVLRAEKKHSQAAYTITWLPSSTARPDGMWKKSVAFVALRAR